MNRGSVLDEARVVDGVASALELPASPAPLRYPIELVSGRTDWLSSSQVLAGCERLLLARGRSERRHWSHPAKLAKVSPLGRADMTAGVEAVTGLFGLSGGLGSGGV